MNNISYKRKLIEKKYNQRESYSLKREDDYFQKYYEIKINTKYGQNKFTVSPSEIKNLIKGSFVEGKGLFEGVFIQKIEQNSFYLSRPVLSFGIITLSFKCKLNLGDSWLDWNDKIWKEKIEESKAKFSFDDYKSSDNYFLKVKNYYESRCLYPELAYFVREKEQLEVLEEIYCGNSRVNTNNIENVNCGENIIYAGEAICNSSYNQLTPFTELICDDSQVLAGERGCADENNKKP